MLIICLSIKDELNNDLRIVAAKQFETVSGGIDYEKANDIDSCSLLAWNGYMTYELYKVKEEKVDANTESNVTVLNSVLTEITDLVMQSELQSCFYYSRNEDETITSVVFDI